MAFVKIWIHAVWGTKNRASTLEKSKRKKLFAHIRENAHAKGMYIDFINGVEDHIHCLMALNADATMAKTMQLIKGEAAHWANQEQLFREKLYWADEYYAVSVSESQIEKVRMYIRNQEEHHRKKTFAEECQEFIDKYGFYVSQG
ncbi:IS200/IS605 family transposase [Runella sp.]|uniref:IS200/IS605 family transposase n=1 Tax=Runella sp. TaxID=1960881 RepID=UPI003D10CF77